MGNLSVVLPSLNPFPYWSTSTSGLLQSSFIKRPSPCFFFNVGCPEALTPSGQFQSKYIEVCSFFHSVSGWRIFLCSLLPWPIQRWTTSTCGLLRFFGSPFLVRRVGAVMDVFLCVILTCGMRARPFFVRGPRIFFRDPRIYTY